MSVESEIEHLIEALASFGHGDDAAINSLDITGTRLFHIHPLPWSVKTRGTGRADIIDFKAVHVGSVSGLLVGASMARMMVAALNAMWKSLVVTESQT